MTVKASPRSLVASLDFRTSAGFLDGNGARRSTRMAGAGPQAVITDFGELTPEPGSDELVLSALFPGVTPGQARAAVGWPLRCGPEVATLEPPSRDEIDALRALDARTREAHRRPVQLPA